MGTVSLGGSLPDKIEAIAAAGFHSVELFDEDLRASGLGAAEVGRRCRDLGLTIDSFQPFRRAEGVPDREFAAVVTRFEAALALAQELGTGSIMIVSNTDPDACGDRDRSARQLAELGAVAGRHGITIRFEALSWGTHVNRVADAWDVLQRAGHGRGCLVVDSFHLLAVGDGPAEVAALGEDAIGLVQLADAPLLPLEPLEWSRNHRCFPGEGQLGVRAAAEAVLAHGFDGTVSLEIFNPAMRREPPREVARRGADALQRLLDELSCPAGGPR